MPESPSIPDSLFNIFKAWEISMPSFFAINSIADGSISPERVPMIKPSNGESPIDVSTDTPSLTAETDAPFPR